MNKQLISKVELRAMDAMTQRTLNCVLPKKGKYLGKLMYPKMYPKMFPTPVMREAQALADSC